MLDVYLCVSKERFEVGGEKRDLDRILFALRRILHLTPEQGLADEDRRTVGLNFARSLMIRYCGIITAEDTVYEGLGDCHDDQFFELWEDMLPHTVVFFRDCQEYVS